MKTTYMVFGTDTDCAFRGGIPLAEFKGNECIFFKSGDAIQPSQNVVLHGAHPSWLGLHIARDLRKKLKTKVVWTTQKDSVRLSTQKTRWMIKRIMSNMNRLEKSSSNRSETGKILCYAVRRREL